MKKLLIWAGILAALIVPANAAGTVPGFALTPQFDALGKIAPGCKLYVITAGTTQTPQNSYQDSALTLLQPNPLTCDSTGRLPLFFLADGTIKVRLTTSAGVQLFVGDNLPVIGPSSGGGGGGGTIDPTTILATGDFKVRYGVGVLTGFVRMNGRTIGSSTSGATERANADAQALFEYLWGADASLVVSTGRGASANADWVANKTIALPDWRGYALAGLADMGNTATSILTQTYFGATPTNLGAGGGFQNFTITTNNLPPYTPSGSISTVFNSAQNFFAGTSGAGAAPGNGGSPVGIVPAGSAGIQPNTWGLSSGFTGVPQGGTSNPHTLVQPTKLATFYLKL